MRKCTDCLPFLTTVEPGEVFVEAPAEVDVKTYQNRYLKLRAYSGGEGGGVCEVVPPPHPRVRKYYYFYIIKDKNILICILTFSFLMAWFTSEKFNCIKGTLNGRFWIPFFSLKPFTHNLKICMLKINHPKYYLGGPTALFRCPSYCLLLRLL